MKNIILSVLFSFCFLPLWGQKGLLPNDSLIKQLLPESSEVGISVYDLTAKKPLYDYRAEKLSPSRLYYETADCHYRPLPVPKPMSLSVRKCGTME